MLHLNNEKDLENQFIQLLKKQNFKNFSSEETRKRKYDEYIFWNILIKNVEKINSIKFKENDKILFMRKIKDLDNKKFVDYIQFGIDFIFNVDGKKKSKSLKLIDFDKIQNNDFNYIQQIQYNSSIKTIRPDIMIYINGLPLVLFELKWINDGDINFFEESIKKMSEAYRQVIDGETSYTKTHSKLFDYNCIVVLASNNEIKFGSHISKTEHFSNWKYIDKEVYDDSLEKIDKNKIFIEGLFNHKRLLEYIRFFIFYRDDGQKIIAKYHQFYSVQNLFNSFLKANEEKNNSLERNKGGYAYHAPGSGKSFQMIFLTKKIQYHFGFSVLVVTDRNDLDNQIYNTFSKASKFLQEKNLIKIKKREQLQKEIVESKQTGKIFFTTIQKFDDWKSNKSISENEKILVIVDEAHRTQNIFDFKIEKPNKEENKFKKKYGWAKHMRDGLPNAIYVGFTGTPLYKTDKSTEDIFGNESTRYNLYQAQKDGTIVELAIGVKQFSNIEKKAKEIKKAIKKYNKLNEESSEASKKIKRKLLRFRKIILENDNFIEKVTKDVVDDWTKKLNNNPEKQKEMNAMLIVSSKEVALEYYRIIKDKLKPYWKGNVELEVSIDEKNKSSSEAKIKKIVKRGAKNRAERFKNPKDPFNFVILVDKWITGFDAPQVRAMYIVKLLKKHTLIQTISRVIRVYDNKEKGLIYDYTTLLYDELQDALKIYGNNENVKVLNHSSEELFEDFNNLFFEIKNLISDETFEKIKKFHECYENNEITNEKLYNDFFKEIYEEILISIKEKKIKENEFLSNVINKLWNSYNYLSHDKIGKFETFFLYVLLGVKDVHNGKLREITEKIFEKYKPKISKIIKNVIEVENKIIINSTTTKEIFSKGQDIKEITIRYIRLDIEKLIKKCFADDEKDIDIFQKKVDEIINRYRDGIYTKENTFDKLFEIKKNINKINEKYTNLNLNNLGERRIFTILESQLFKTKDNSEIGQLTKNIIKILPDSGDNKINWYDSDWFREDDGEFFSGVITKIRKELKNIDIDKNKIKNIINKIKRINKTIDDHQ